MKKTVLIVEDEALMCEVIRDYFEDAGFEVTDIDDGLKAIEIIDDKEFDLILLDIMIPGLDGFSICRHIRKKLKTPLAIIRAYTEGLMDGVSPKNSEKYMRVIIQEIEKMDSLILSMLENSRLESGAEKLVIKEYDICFRGKYKKGVKFSFTLRRAKDD